jgi:uncharacterized protein YoxC
MPKLDHDTIELIFIGLTAICFLFQTILLFAVSMAALKGIKSLTAQVDELRSSAMPVIDHTRGFVERMTPKVEETAKNVATISQTLKEHTVTVGATATEIVHKVNTQSTRIDGMVTSALDTLDNAAVVVVENINKPVRQLSGVLAAIKAVVEVLGTSHAAQTASHASEDRDSGAGI